MKRRSLMVLAALVFSATPVVVGQSPVAAAGTCMDDGTNCKVGDVGPRGGIVYYDAGSMQWWGRFLEAQTTSTPADGIWGASASLTGGASVEGISVAMKQLGMGWQNSFFMNYDSSSVVHRLMRTSFSTGFYLPSKDELDALYNYWKISGDKRLEYPAAPMWTSTEASATFAWYQLFQDGTQFTDANGIIRGLKQNKAFLKSPEHTGSNFKPTSFEVIGVRAFPFFGNGSSPINSVMNTKSNVNCSNGGAATVCNVGDIGPGGGIVFYDAGKEEYWGRYLEIAPQSCEGVRYPWRPAGNNKTVYKPQGDQTAAELRVLAKGIGMGKVNTRIITLALGAGKYAAKYAEDLVCGGRDDWFLPSKDELDTAYNRLAQNRVGSKDTPIGGFNKGYYWTSTDYNDKTAWSQYFMDGQQFDRVQTMDGNKTPPNPFRVRAIRAFGTNTVVLPCAQGGSCKIGDTGPGGGKVFYVAPDFFMVNGKSARYLEASPQDSQGAWCKEKSNCQRMGRLAVARDSGAVNTSQILNSEGVLPDVGELIKQGVNGKFDWYVPSIDELIKLNRQRDMVGGFRWGYYWSSSFVNGGMLGFGLKMHRGNAADEVLFRWEPAGIRLIRAFG
jgi:hypothetical protein